MSFFLQCFWNRLWLIELFSLNRYMMVRYGYQPKLLLGIATPLGVGSQRMLLIRIVRVFFLWTDHIPELYRLPSFPLFSVPYFSAPLTLLSQPILSCIHD